MTVEFWIGFIVALFALGGIVVALARLGRLPATGKDAAMPRQVLEGKLRDLEATVKVLQQDHVRDAEEIRKLVESNRQLANELAQAQVEITLLKRQLAQYQPDLPQPGGPDFPLLAVFGPDDAITAADEGALNQSGIPFKCVYGATRDLVAAELGRRRRANDLYRWLHIATHAGPEGMLLIDDVASREWWNKQLSGVEGVFLAGCTDVAVADWLVGVVKWVLSFTVDIDNELARQFALVFWSTLADGKAPRDAYRTACRSVPQLAKTSDFRLKG